jgi:hypothetical protein
VPGSPFNVQIFKTKEELDKFFDLNSNELHLMNQRQKMYNTYFNLSTASKNPSPTLIYHQQNSKPICTSSSNSEGSGNNNRHIESLL